MHFDGYEQLLNVVQNRTGLSAKMTSSSRLQLTTTTGFIVGYLTVEIDPTGLYVGGCTAFTLETVRAILVNQVTDPLRGTG